MAELDRLFEPGRIGAVDARNRIVMPAMGTGFGEPDGTVSDRSIAYYVRRAQGAPGIVITEIACVHPSGSIVRVLNCHDDRFIPGMARLAAAIKDHGPRAFFQLYHPGRQTASQITGHALVAPSAVASRPANEVPQPASLETIHEIIDSFVRGAERAAQAGFDGVEIHGAHGYLISAFLSPAANRRDDEFGGDTSRRARIATEIIGLIRARLGPSFGIIFRFSAEDGLPGGVALDEGIAIAKLAEQAGADALSVSAGSYEANDRMVPPMWAPMATNVHLAAAVRRAVNIPVIVAGRLNDPKLAAGTLAEGAADFVAIGRGLLADPDWPTKVQSGRVGEIRRCIACETCRDSLHGGAGLRCLLNPELGREGHFALTNVREPKRVMVVGGGPGGMQAAAALAERGHTVTLYERERELGGKIRLCAAPEWKQGFQELGSYLAAQVRKHGAAVNLGQTVTAELVAREAPDAVVVATGAEPVLPAVPGLDADTAIMAEDVLRGMVIPGKRVFIMGGAATACELALALARRGHEVTIARRGARIGKGLARRERWHILPELERRGVRMLAGVSYEAVIGGGVVIVKDGERETVAADTVICATGYTPKGDLAQALEASGVIVYAIGDCVRPRALIDATREAALVAVELD